MQTTRKNAMLIVLFVVVFAVMFFLEGLQASGTSVKAHPLLASTVVQEGFCPDSTLRHHAPYASILAHFAEKEERYEG
jgi:hypothetical protein